MNAIAKLCIFIVLVTVGGTVTSVIDHYIGITVALENISHEVKMFHELVYMLWGGIFSVSLKKIFSED
jgi:hypothetical protein